MYSHELDVKSVKSWSNENEGAVENIYQHIICRFSLSNDNNNNKGGLDFSYPPVYNLIKKGNQMQDLMPSVKFNFFLC